MTTPVNDMRDITVTVNGQSFSRTCETRINLADFLRHDLGLTGTHVGCEHGVCGACTVLVDGAAVRGCLMLAVQADGAAVQTIEGLAAADGTLSVMQAAFAKHHAVQCGFCTPGILMTLAEVERETGGDVDETSVREALSGNLCRCTGYQNIVDAAMEALAQLRQARGEVMR
jgi:carbon-monoxide dehydrogenase small subunit